MNVDTAIQHMLFKSTELEMAELVWCARRDRPDTIQRFRETFGWLLEECEEFLDNIMLAFDTIVNSD